MSLTTLRAAEGGAGGDSTPGSDTGERITRLFPKCRPRNNNRMNSSLESRGIDPNNVNYSSDEEQQLDNLDENQQQLNSSKGLYKLRDSRIIQIAGGRELYSQSRTKVHRKSRHSGGSHKHSSKNKSRVAKENTYSTDNFNHYNDLTNNRIPNSCTSSASKAQVPLTNGDRKCQLSDAKRDVDTVDECDDNPPKGSPIAVSVADGELVVLDNISEDWKVIVNSVSLGVRPALEPSDVIDDDLIPNSNDAVRNFNSGGKMSDDEPSPSNGDRLKNGWCDGNNSLTRVIGELPIAEYEGSPRRYGVGCVPAARSPRPGFPQRVINEANESLQAPASTFDYLYEFSETRKVLEEFFKCPTNDQGQIINSPNDDLVDFNDLDYELHRQQTESHSEVDYTSGNDEKETTPPHSPDPPNNMADTEESATDSPKRKLIQLPLATMVKHSPKNRIIHSPINRVLHSPIIRVTRSPIKKVVHSPINKPDTPKQDSPERVQCSPEVQYSPERVQVTPEKVSDIPDVRLRNSPVLSSEIRLQHSPDLSPDKRILRSPEAMVAPSPLGGAWYLNQRIRRSHERDIDSPPLYSHPNFRGLQTSVYEAASEWSGSARSGDSCSADSDLSLVDNNDPKTLEMNRSIKMPFVEDGLSSGHVSDADNNNQTNGIHNNGTDLIEENEDMALRNEHEQRNLSNVDIHSLDPLGTSPPPPAPAPHRPDSRWRSRKRTTPAGSPESLARKQPSNDEDEADTDLETDRLLGQQRTDDQGFFDDKGWKKPKSRTLMPATRSPPQDHVEDVPPKDKEVKKKGKNKEVVPESVLLEGVLFRARYLGSTQLAAAGAPTKPSRMLQAEEAVSRIKEWEGEGCVFRINFLGSVEVEEESSGRRRKKRAKKTMVEEAVTQIKAPEGESQPSTEVDLFISTEKIMVLNTELKEIMMDHALRTISYIADIGDLVVLMARRRFVSHDAEAEPSKVNRAPKMICHVFESEEAQFIAQSIGQAFQVAYMEFLKANGIEDHSFVKEMDYQEVLNSQEIFGDELQMFAKKELQKEVVVPKAKGEILGVVVVESGWGSMLPTVVIANLAPAGAAARCGQLNIGDQIIAINGVSLVGLPLSTCQTYIKNSKTQTVVKLTVVPCPPVVEVKIKRPDTKYQLGFSVQNGVICSLLRGGIAERGGVRVGHRIIEINSQSVVAVPHERIVNLLATSVGEILMKTMPTSMFRLLTGQENPIYI